MEKLPGAKFLIFDIGESQFQPICGEREFGKYSIVELGNYKNTIVLEKNAVIKRNNYILKVGQCVDLDSNVIGSWKNMVMYQKNDSDLLDMLLFIKRMEKQVSCVPYLFESGANSFDIEKEVVYRNLLAFSILDGIDKSALEKKEFITDSLAYGLADDRWNELIKLEEEIKAEPIDRYEFIYCLLLKAFYIKHSSKKSMDHKILQLLNSINNELFSYWENEMILCYLFLKGDKSVEKFFGGVQVNAKDIFRKLKGMAWDLFHLRCIEMHMAERNCEPSFTYLHSFCSADRGILDIVKLNPIIRMAFYNGNSIVLHEKNIFNTCTHIDVSGILAPYADKRLEMCMKTDYRELSKRFEKDVLSIMNAEN
ncbi:hypothetical protein HB836_02160 [Listeria booriae]|uniref:Uncharacterized protein n=3 Tax=Listeria booriae TaxID=1552123 RepID=A0A841YIX8_9LIST|nr:hypothetical protein [Listeria booriae]MBC1400385.1 hypothetical protein [Listeria booriae]